MPMETPAHIFTQAEELLVHLAGHIQDHSTLWSLSLASRTFYRIFRDYLWADIVWDDRNDKFFSDKSRLANFLFTHEDDISRAHSLRTVKKCISHDSFDQDEWLTISDHYGFLDYLDGMKLLQSHMPNLKSFEWAGPCDYGTIQSLAQHCPRLERLCVCSTGDDRLSKLASRRTLKGASYKSLPCLTSAAYHQASLWGSFERRANVSDEASRYILDKAPALESMSFHWPKMRHIENERRAVEDFIFFFIVTRAPEDLYYSRYLMPQKQRTDSYPLMLRNMQVCVSAYDQDGRVCPKCAGRPTVETMAVDGEDPHIASLLKRVADSFEWTLQECLSWMVCSAWSNGYSFWHVSITTTPGGAGR